jgi:hypothetical protein
MFDMIIGIKKQERSYAHTIFDEKRHNVEI